MYQGITFDGYYNNLQLIAYVDALQADDINSRKSTGSYILIYGGIPISQKSGRQLLVIYSTTEAEYVQLVLTAKEAIAISRLIDKLDTFSTKATVFPITIYKDNQPAIDIINRLNRIDGRTKHISTKYYYVRQLNGTVVNVLYIATTEQKANSFTKLLDRLKHQSFI